VSRSRCYGLASMTAEQVNRGLGEACGGASVRCSSRVGGFAVHPLLQLLGEGLEAMCEAAHSMISDRYDTHCKCTKAPDTRWNRSISTVPWLREAGQWPGGFHDCLRVRPCTGTALRLILETRVSQQHVNLLEVKNVHVRRLGESFI
jgi:hypothetical protein